MNSKPGVSFVSPSRISISYVTLSGVSELSVTVKVYSYIPGSSYM